jgi:hypothetical protein
MNWQIVEYHMCNASIESDITGTSSGLLKTEENNISIINADEDRA